MPEGFEQVIEDFDMFGVDIREVNYFVGSNTLRISLTLNIEKATQEDISQLLNVLTEYFRAEQFAKFWKNIQGDNPEPFSISLQLFNTNNERTHALGASQSHNFGDWDGYFGE